MRLECHHERQKDLVESKGHVAITLYQNLAKTCAQRVMETRGSEGGECRPAAEGNGQTATLTEGGI